MKIVSKGLALGAMVAAFYACAQSEPESTKSAKQIITAWQDLSLREKPDAITNSPWSEVVINVPDPETFSRLFTDIGGFEVDKREGGTLLLTAVGSKSGAIRVRPSAQGALLTRPLDSKAWDTGCYWSVMMRAKGLESIIKDAEPLDWKPHFPMTYLEFGPSKLHVVVLRHQTTGVQVQLYERLTTPLPEGFLDFERLSVPFNLMQMVEDRDAAYDFFQQGLGFETFFYGKPYTSQKPEDMPLGLPKDLTTSIPYRTAILSPQKGDEVGRIEMISFDKY